MYIRECRLPRDARCFAHINPSSHSNETVVADESERKLDLSSVEKLTVEIQPKEITEDKK